MTVDPDLYPWVILPSLVFLARVFDVTLGTMRIIFISRGKKYLAPLFGFVEVFIWIAIIAQIVHAANNLMAYLAYAAGFAVGNFVGMFIEDRLALGMMAIRIIVQNRATELVARLRDSGYGVTTVKGEGVSGPVVLVYTIAKRRSISELLAIIHQTHPHAFLSIEDVRSTQEGIFPVRIYTSQRAFFERKSK